MSKKFELSEDDERIEAEKEHLIQGLEPDTVNEGAKSFFDGGLLGFIGWGILAFILMVITLGIGTPWAECMLYRYQFKHTAYNGHRLKFRGSGLGLLGNTIKWIFFTIITLGIYGLFVPVKKAKWIISNLHYEDEGFVKGDSYFDGSTLQLIGLNILMFILTIVSFGILYPFTVCMKYGWINKHSVICKKRLVYNGKAIFLWGKYILWTILTIITLGIFSLWAPIFELKWHTKNTHIKTVLGKDYKKDNTIWLVIPITIICAIIMGFAIKGLSEYDWNKSNIEFEVMNIVTKIQPHIGREDDVDELKKALYSRIYDKYSDGYISEREMEKLIQKYDLEDYESELDIDEINEKVIGTGDNKKVTPLEEKKPVKNDYIIVGGYKIAYGTYTGKDSLYDIENQVSIPVDIKIILEEDSITVDGIKQKYTVSGDMISINGLKILQATGENTLVYLAQSSPVLTYQGK